MLIDKIINLHYKTLNWPKYLTTVKIAGMVRWILYIGGNLLMYLQKNKKQKINNSVKNSEVIVSLTSIPERINTVWITIESIMWQTTKPKSIILWLSKDQFPSLNILPKRLIEQQKRGLDIRLVEGDILAHKKYYYAFQEFPKKPVLLIDDDIIYNSLMITTLLKGFNPDKIHFSYGKRIARNNDLSIKPYKNWRYLYGKANEEDLFFGTGGGTLLVPSSLYKDTLNENIFNSLCPFADDIWLNAMARLSNLNIEKVRNEGCFKVIILKNKTLTKFNINDNQNDFQLTNVNQYYLKVNGKRVF